jgi:hypothetical protein
MSEFDRRPDTESPDDPLDQLLSEAEWPQPDAETVNRLRRRWASLRAVHRGRERRRRLLYWLTASAALITLAATWWLWPPAPEESRPIAPVVPSPHVEQIAVDQNTDRSNTPDVPAPNVPDSERVDIDEPIMALSRPPTPYELLLIHSVERRSSIPPAETGPTLDTIIDEFLADPDADAAAVVASLKADHGTCEQKLLELIDDAPPPQQSRIIQLLQHVGSRRCVPKLLELSVSPAMHGDAMRALTVLADAETLAALASRETDSVSRQLLLTELLSRQDEQSLGAWLDLLMNGQTRDAALATLDENTMPPVRLLFDFMRGPDYSRRMAAAIVLGRLDDPDVTKSLIRLSQSNFNRQEALVGLLASRDKQAGRFLALATRDQTMVAAVYSAQLQLQSISQQQWRNLP